MFPLALENIGQFEKNNSGLAANESFDIKKDIYTACRSDLKRKVQ